MDCRTFPVIIKPMIYRYFSILSGAFFTRSGFGAANGDIAESRLLQPVFKGARTETEKQGGGRYYVSFRGEDPSAKTFVDILVGAASRHPYRGDGPVNAFELRVPRSPSRPFFPSPSAARFTGRTRWGRWEGTEKRGVQHPCFFIRQCGGTLGLILPSHSPDFNSLPLHRVGYQRNEITKVLGCTILLTHSFLSTFLDDIFALSPSTYSFVAKLAFRSPGAIYRGWRYNGRVVISHLRLPLSFRARIRLPARPDSDVRRNRLTLPFLFLRGYSRGSIQR